MNRPLVWAAVALAAGIWCAGLSEHPLFWIGAAAATLILLNRWRWPVPLPYRDAYLVAFIFLLLGAGLENTQRSARRSDALASHNRQNPERIYRLSGIVQSAAVFVPGMKYMPVRLRVDEVRVSGHKSHLSGGVVLRWSEPAFAIHPGERLELTGRLDPVLGEVNLGLGGVEDYYRTHGYHSVMRVRGDYVQKTARPRWSIPYWASRLRQWQSDVFSETAPAPVQPFLRAVWLGDRAAFDEDTYRPYLETGTAHILAVSGVHIGIVYLTLQLVLRSFLRNRKWRAVVIMGAVLLFALAAGGRTPILRAALMLYLYLCAELLDREPDAPTALSIAAMLFLCWNPGLVRDTGFALSFTSLASILIFSETLNERLTAIPEGIRQNISAAAGVSLLPLPIGAHVFHVIPLIGPVCNLLVIPLLTGVLGLCMLTVVTATISLPFARLFGHATWPLVQAIAWVTEQAARLPISSITVTSPTMLACACYVGACLCLACWLWNYPHARRWLCLGGLALVATWLTWKPFSHPATLDFLDVAHGDATFIRTPGGTTLLVDGGNKNEYLSMGTRVVVPWLLAQGVDHLDFLVVTHPDSDHIGGVADVLSRIGTGAVVLWPDKTVNPLERELLEQCQIREIPVLRVATGHTLPVAGASVRVLHPKPDLALPGENNLSLVLHVQWPGMNALLTGDIEVEAERMLLNDLPPVDVLKVPHHGSHTSSSAPFLDAVSPRIAVVSTRASGQRQAVGKGVLPRYESRAITVYRTDDVGGVQVRVENGALVVRSARAIRGYSLAPE